ncbi:MAG: hypothetical protein ACI9JU_002368 [Pseudohongiellaceae bacterium]|jgi:hypothetical protein
MHGIREISRVATKYRHQYRRIVLGCIDEMIHLNIRYKISRVY